MDGVDHAFLYCLENVTGHHFIHGQAVGLGIYLGSELQDNEPEAMLATLHRTGVDIRPEAMGVTLGRCRDGDATSWIVCPFRRVLVYRRGCTAGHRRAARSGEGAPVRDVRNVGGLMAPAPQAAGPLERRSTMIRHTIPGEAPHDGGAHRRRHPHRQRVHQLGRVGRSERRRAVGRGPEHRRRRPRRPRPPQAPPRPRRPSTSRSSTRT